MTQYHAIGEIVDNRYRIVAHLGQGSSGITYAAKTLTTERLVALKVLTLRGLDDWKKLELFEREANVLATLNHPGIPAYVDYFQVDTPSDRAFYIVQTLAEGKSLAALVAEGWRTDETGVKQIAFKVLTILDYLHNLNPPIIHRDIKPQNIIRRDDGEISLVDFGAVQQVYRDTMSYGSTVVGTYGYMSPEQFRGQAFPGTDLYGLGTTLLFLLTHRPPAELPQRRLKLQFRQAVTVSDDFANWLDGLLEPLIEDRLGSAQAASNALKRPQSRLTQTPKLTHSTGALPIPRLKKPVNSQIKLKRNNGHLQVYIPNVPISPITLYSRMTTPLTLRAIGRGFLFINFSFAAIVASVAAERLSPEIVFIIVLFSLGAAVFLLMRRLGTVRLDINARMFRLEQSALGLKRLVRGDIADLVSVELPISKENKSRPITLKAWIEGGDSYMPHRFGHTLTQSEKAWLVQEINDFLQPLQSTNLPPSEL